MESEAMVAFNAELMSIVETRPPIGKTKIVEITKLALKAIKYYKHVVFSVERLIGKVKAEYKVPLLYVIDSILRQSKRQFKEKDVFGPRFAKNFGNTLSALLQCPPSDRLKIARTLNLWEANGVFPGDKISELRSICQDNGLETDLEAVEKAVKGPSADLTIYQHQGEKGPPKVAQERAAPLVVADRPSDDIPPGGVSEAELLRIVQSQMFDIGMTLEKDMTLLRTVYSMILERLDARVKMEANANKQVSVKLILSSNFDYSDEEDNEEEKEEQQKPPPPPTHQELYVMTENIVAEAAAEIRCMHGTRISKLQQAAMEAKRSEALRMEAQKAAAAAIAAQKEEKEKEEKKRKDDQVAAAVAQAQSAAAAQQQQIAATQHGMSVFGSPPKVPGPPPGMILPPGVDLNDLSSLPKVSLAGNPLGLLNPNAIGADLSSLSSFLNNPLGILGQPGAPSGAPPQLNPSMLAAMGINPFLLSGAGGSAAGGPVDLQALLSHPPPAGLPHGLQMPPGLGGITSSMAAPVSMAGHPALGHHVSQHLAQAPPSFAPPPGPPSGAPPHMQHIPPTGMPMFDQMTLPPSTGFSPNRPPPSLLSMDTSQGMQTIMMQHQDEGSVMQMMLQQEEDDRRDGERRDREGGEERHRGDPHKEREEHRRDRKRDHRDRDEKDSRRDREHRDRDDSRRGDKKRRRSRSRDRDGSDRHRSRDERDDHSGDRHREREGDKERRKLGLPSHPKNGTTLSQSG